MHERQVDRLDHRPASVGQRAWKLTPLRSLAAPDLGSLVARSNTAPNSQRHAARYCQPTTVPLVVNASAELTPRAGQLIDNAVKYTPGDTKARVQVGREGTWARLSVRMRHRHPRERARERAGALLPRGQRTHAYLPPVWDCTWCAAP